MPTLCCFYDPWTILPRTDFQSTKLWTRKSGHQTPEIFPDKRGVKIFVTREINSHVGRKTEKRINFINCAVYLQLELFFYQIKAEISMPLYHSGVEEKESLHDFRVNVLVIDTHMYIYIYIYMYEWTSITWFILDGIYRQKTAPFLDVKSLETHP